MPQLTINADDEVYRRLVADAVVERRPVDFQAEVTLRRALGLPVSRPKRSRVELNDAGEAIR